MTFGEAIQSGFRNYVGFSGRAARSEYWYWILFVVMVAIAAGIVDMAIIGNAAFRPLSTLISLGLFLPNLAIAIRRLHDHDKSGWFVLLALIPIVGAIILLVWFVQRGTVGGNRFGADPLGPAG